MGNYSHIIFWLRAVSCMSIVMIHSITTTFYKVDSMDHPLILRVFQLLLMFSTPMFIFISEFLLAKRQGPNVKDGFIKNKLKYLGIPYTIINIGLAYVYSRKGDWNHYFEKLNDMMFHGGTVTYFIIIIFQFYFLHIILGKQLIKFKPVPTVIVSLLISSLYWGIRNFVTPIESPFLNWIWNREGWMVFIGWFGYFTLGFYIGVYYDQFINKIRHYTWHIIILFVTTTIIMVSSYYFEILKLVESKRIDTPFYCTSVILMVFLLSTYINYLPKFIVFISNYSFSIYLIHYFFVHRLGKLSDDEIKNVIFNFILTLVLSVVTAHLVNKLKLGKFIVGGIGKFKYEDLIK